MKIAAGRSAPTLPALYISLAAVIANASPAREVRVTQVNPETTGGLEDSTCSVKEFYEMVDIPCGIRLKTKNAPGIPIPAVRGHT